MNYRGIIHFHSKYSYDSVLTFKQISNIVRSESLNFLILTDHNTIKGSKVLQSYLDSINPDVEIVIAAEYETEYGDMIAAFISEEISAPSFKQFVSQVRMQDGLLLLPHPYSCHIEIDLLAKEADMIEIYNSRISDTSNEKACALARIYNKPSFYGCDAHNADDLANVIVEFEKNGDLKQSLLASKIFPLIKKKSTHYSIIKSQIIKALRKKNFKLLFFYIAKFFKYFIIKKLYKNI